MFAATSSITFIVYTLVEVIKTAVGENTKFDNFIPLISAFLGLAIALAVYFIAPTLLGFTNALDAVVSGLMSGLAATGTNQVFKQIAKFNK